MATARTFTYQVAKSHMARAIWDCRPRSCAASAGERPAAQRLATCYRSACIEARRARCQATGHGPRRGQRSGALGDSGAPSTAPGVDDGAPGPFSAAAAHVVVPLAQLARLGVTVAVVAELRFPDGTRQSYPVVP